jgi:hypothetical protein
MRHVSEPSRDPIDGLYAEALRLRGIVFSRLAAVGCNTDDVPRVEATVNANIGELVAAPEWAMLLDQPGGKNRLLTLLVQSCAARVDAKIQPPPARCGKWSAARRVRQPRPRASQIKLLARMIKQRCPT